MQIFERWLHARNKKVIDRYVDSLGHRVGWSIEGKDITDLLERSRDQFINALDGVIGRAKMKFFNLTADLTTKCEEHHRVIEEGKTELKLMYCSTGTRILITNYSGTTGGPKIINQFRLLYRGVGWTISHEDDKFDFDLATFNTMSAKIHDAQTNDDMLSAVRHINWVLCTLNDIAIKVDKWEIYPD